MKKASKRVQKRIRGLMVILGEGWGKNEADRASPLLKKAAR